MKGENNLTDILITVFISCFVGMLSGACAIYTMNSKGSFNIKRMSNSDLSEISEIYDKIKNEYYQDVSDDVLIEGAISGMLSTLDANTTYLNEGNTTSFNNKMKGEYYGIGLGGLTLENTGILVMTITENSPAEKAGIKEGDIITKVNDVDLANKTATYFTTLVSKSQDQMRLAIKRGEETLDINLKADKIVINSVTTNTFYRNNKNIGYIKISIFAANTASQFTTKLKELENNGIDSLIIDVRDNAGGYLSNVSTILELFMKKDTVLYKTETKTNSVSRKDNTEEYRSYPVVVLVNGSSASASEILASCFKENYNSTIIGTTTYGKGTVQETVSILDSSMAKITTKKWLTSSGEWINEKGIEPDIKVSLNDTYLKNPIYDNDNQLASAINVIVNK